MTNTVLQPPSFPPASLSNFSASSLRPQPILPTQVLNQTSERPTIQKSRLPKELMPVDEAKAGHGNQLLLIFFLFPQLTESLPLFCVVKRDFDTYRVVRFPLPTEATWYFHSSILHPPPQKSHFSVAQPPTRWFLS